MALPEEPNTLLQRIKAKCMLKYGGNEEKANDEIVLRLYHLLGKPRFLKASEQHRVEIIREIHVCVRREFRLTVGRFDNELFPQMKYWIGLNEHISELLIEFPLVVRDREQEQKRLTVEAVAASIGGDSTNSPAYHHLTRDLSYCTRMLTREADILKATVDLNRSIDELVSKFDLSAKTKATSLWQLNVDQSDTRLHNELLRQPPNVERCVSCVKDLVTNAGRVLTELDGAFSAYRNQAVEIERAKKEFEALKPKFKKYMRHFEKKKRCGWLRKAGKVRLRRETNHGAVSSANQ